MLLSAASLILVTLACITAAPLEGPVRIGLPLLPASSRSRAVEVATDRLSELRDAAVENAKAVNQLVSSNLETSAMGYNTLVENLNSKVTRVNEGIRSGISAAGDLLTDNLAAAENVVTRQVNSVGKLAAQGLTIIKGAVRDLPDGAPVNPTSQIAKSIGGAVDNILPSHGVFAEQPRKISTAILEQEGLGSKSMSFKENIEAFFASMFKPKPVVDTITEEEKYGNTGDHILPLTRAVVKGSESLSSFISNAINLPFDAFKEITRSATTKLNNLGGRIIGL